MSKYNTLFQTTVLNEATGCLNQLQLIQPSDRCVKSVKNRFLEAENTYTCRSCSEQHDLKEAKFARSKYLILDGEANPHTPLLVPNRMMESDPYGEDEFTITIDNQFGKASLS